MDRVSLCVPEPPIIRLKGQRSWIVDITRAAELEELLELSGYPLAIG